MQRVKAPDGSIIAFPDSMGDEEISAVMRKQFGGPKPEDVPPPLPETKTKSQRGTFLDPFIGQGVLMGGGDELKSFVRAAVKAPFSDKDFGEIRAQELANARADLEGFRERNPVIAPVAEVGGAVAGALGTGAAGLIPRAATTAGRLAAAGGLGAAESAVYGFNAGEGGLEPRLKNAAVSAAVGAPLGVAGGAVASRMANKATSKAVPTTKEIADEGRAAFKAMAAEGIALKPAASQKLLSSVIKPAAQRRVDPVRHPHTYAVLQHVAKLAKKPGGMTLEETHQVRQWLGTATRTKNPDLTADRELAGELTDALDDTIEKITVLDTTGGKDPKKATTLLRKGIDDWRTAKKAEILDDIFSNAELDAAGKYTQAGMETAIRNQFRTLSKNKNQMRRFSAAEQKAIRNVVLGGNTRINLTNLLRGMGKFSPRGPVTGIIMGSTIATNPPLGLAAFGVAEASKFAATRRGMGAANRASELVRNKGVAPARGQLTEAQRQKVIALVTSGVPLGEAVQQVAETK